LRSHTARLSAFSFRLSIVFIELILPYYKQIGKDSHKDYT
jgi:hypothetical protein